jgi:hypothetical protein
VGKEVLRSYQGFVNNSIVERPSSTATYVNRIAGSYEERYGRRLPRMSPIKAEFTTLGRLQESHLLSPDFRTWMISSTSETVAMALHMESDGEQGKQTCKTLCSMMQDYPNLEELDLVSYSHEYWLSTVLSHTTGAPLFANLAYLSLWGVNVASGGDLLRYECSKVKLGAL